MSAPDLGDCWISIWSGGLPFCSSNRARFFNDVFSRRGFGGIWHTLRAFYDGDAYLALPLGSQLVDQMVSFGRGRLT